MSLSPSTKNRQDIHANWQRDAKEKRKTAVLLQQGGCRYADDDGISAPKKIEEIDNDDEFYFDPEVPAIQRFIHFKATVIGRSMQDQNKNEELEEGDEPEEKQLTHI